MLDKNDIVNCPYTSADVRNAYHYLGFCQAFKAGKFVETTAPTSMSPPAAKIGDSVQADLIPLSTPTIGGNTILMLLQDEYSGYFTVVALRNKNKECVRDGIIAVDAMYRSHGHAIRRLHTDAEPVFTSIVEQLAAIGILHVQSIPGRHARRIERAIRTLKERARTIMASLPFELPKSLLGDMCNIVSTLYPATAVEEWYLIQRFTVHDPIISLGQYHSAEWHSSNPLPTRTSNHVQHMGSH